MMRHRSFTVLLISLMAVTSQLAACGMTTSPLHSFIKSDRNQEALEMIGSGVAVNERDQMGYTPLHLAAIKGNQAIVEALLEQGADRNSRDFYGRTPFAATKGDADMVTFLIGHGADVNIRDQDGWSALHFAGAGKHSGIIRALLAADAKPFSLKTEALGTYATGAVYEESAVMHLESESPEKARGDYLIAADHFTQAAEFYDNLAAGYQKKIEEQHAKNAFALGLGAFAMALQPGSSMPTASGGTVKLYTPVVVPQGSVGSFESAQTAYLLSKNDASARAAHCRDAAEQT